ncbi:MAG: hypothetical protein CFH26_00778 [Alphaproteobacteria bacterium MarineAlpha6_Bin4]|nr:MAG: hypothetical protein CFH25_00159 [Alphaproteobacteria bacterium MarineAlpha6_Bin3]PPR37369.1 MAG: hypothetical protein CFH26_00778 [Alphaproteobacteria bacterium MarineAlpha6_Bin4]|tara:strand:+ start:1032 stop:1517 length:486 start_codon:yes stop_codon:yes gene_type:complete
MANLNNIFNPLFLKDKELKTAFELLFFTIKDFDRNISSLLKKFGYNKTHFAVIFLASNNYYLTIKDLLVILDIKKQSLAKIINKLKNDDIIFLKKSKKDKRNKNIYLTKKGMKIEKKLTEKQINNIANAYKNAGTESINGFKKILINLVGKSSKVILRKKI